MVGVAVGVLVMVAVGDEVAVEVELGVGVNVWVGSGVTVGFSMTGGSPRTRAVRNCSRIPVRSACKVTDGQRELRNGMIN